MINSVGLPVIGIGGVQHGQDAVDLLRAGASLVAIGTESFRDPLAARRIAREASALARRGELENRPRAHTFGHLDK